VAADGEALARRALAAFEARDADTWAACFDPECEFLLPRNLIEGGAYYGEAGVRRAIADAFETWESIHFEVSDVEQDGAVMIITARVVNTPRGDRPVLDYQTTYGGRFGPQGIKYWRPYDSADEARAALT